MIAPGAHYATIVRTALGAGRHVARGLAVGVTVGNGVACITAFAVLDGPMLSSPWVVMVQFSGCVFLLCLAGVCLRDAGTEEFSPISPQMRLAMRARASWVGTEAGAILALSSARTWMLYFTLAAFFDGPTAGTTAKIVYAIWTMGATLLLGLMLAHLGSSPSNARRFSRTVPWMENLAGIVLSAVSIGLLAGVLAATMAWPGMAAPMDPWHPSSSPKSPDLKPRG